MAATGSLKPRIEGADCSACTLKIEITIKRLPRVSTVSL
jgi:hypothetical protein